MKEKQSFKQIIPKKDSRIIKIMKTVIIFLFICVSAIYANDTFSQTAHMTITAKNRTLNQVFTEIEKQSDYAFLISDKISGELSKQVNIDAKDRSVGEILESVLADTDLAYHIVGRQITIFKKEEKNNLKVSQQPVPSIREIKGIVYDEESEPIIGSTVVIKGTTIGTVTDLHGTFKLNAKANDTISVSYIGYQTQNVHVGNKVNIVIVLKQNAEVMDEVVVTAWGKEKKSSMVGSISSVSPKELRGPTSNLTTMLAGRVAGVVSYQLSGEPGRDNAEFFVRGVGSFGDGRQSPLILINGIESTANDLARIQPDDIEGFSVLKDATAASMYGSRGASGVILVNTKRGIEGKTKFNVRYESTISQNTRDYNLADNVTYMKLANEATLTRSPLAQRPYSLNQIDKTIQGGNSLLYPSNNWKDLMIKNHTVNHRVNFNLSGGGGKAVYYISGTFRQDNGVLKEHKLNDFNTNVKSTNYEIRSNVNINLTSTTRAAVRISGLFDEVTGPIGTGESVFKNMLLANPVKFPAIYPQSYRSWAEHPLFGNASRVGGDSGTTNAPLYFNPYAQALSGYQSETGSRIDAQFEFEQDFGFFTEGLRARMMAYTKRYALHSHSRSVNPFYYGPEVDPDNSSLLTGLYQLNPQGGTEYLGFTDGDKLITSDLWAEVGIYYDRTFNNVHQIGGTLLGYISDISTSRTGGQVELSLPRRRTSFSGRATYAYDNRYLAEFNFGYNASERFAKNHRWGFFPSYGLAWNVNEESFLKPYNNIFHKIKLRASYGIVGNDEISDSSIDRFFYISRMNMNPDAEISFGQDYRETWKHIYQERYANPDITWEKSKKTNLALELGLFRDFELEFDYFTEKRSQILMTRADLPSSLGLSAPVRASVGKASSRGFEATVNYNKDFNKDMWLQVRGTFTYATNKYVYNEEPAYPADQKHRSKIGNRITALYGLIAERLFIDEEDVKNSPLQFNQKINTKDGSGYGPGDIKYRDVNGDGIIDNKDVVPMGYPTVPEIVYGFGFSYGFKDFDINAYFQGQGRSSFMIDYNLITPFLNHGDGKVNGLLDVIAKDHWSESNRDPYAFFPRLSVNSVNNNAHASNWWLRDANFLRLKTLEIGYEPKKKAWLNSMGLNSLRVYLSGMNLFTISNFKLWDVEMRGNGLGYPLQRVYNIGVQLSF